MLVLKCILGAIIGAICGFIAMIAGGIAILIVVGIIMWDSNKGEAAAEFMGPFFVLAGIIVGIIVPIYIPIYKESQRKKEEKDRIQLEAKRAKGALDTECTSLAALIDTSKSIFLSLKQLVPAANTHLDKAEREFNEGAFAPFWDEVEHATNRLAEYHQAVNTIDRNATEYTSRASRLSVSIPKFDMPKGKLSDARPVAVRLSKIVRQAQKDFQFATIYEQRKTNQLLYAGFGTLASAIDRMQTSIVDVLKGLSTSLDTKLDDLVSSMNEQAETQEYLLEESERQSEMLDNIQRRRKLLP